MAERIETVDWLDPEQRAAVDALIRAATIADGVPPIGEHKYLKLHTGGGSARALLAYDDDRLCGYAQLLATGDRVTAEVVVDPDARGRGLGGRLIAAARRLAAAAGARELKLWSYGALAPAAAAAARQGLAARRTLLELERPLDTLPPRPALRGYAVRRFDPDRDCETWLQLHDRIFADHPEHGAWSLDDLEARLSQPWFDAEDFLIAERGGRMVGFNWLKRTPDPSQARPQGEIYIIGVAGSERGRGLGRALAVLGLHHLRERGMAVCILYVEGDNAPALRLYRALGFMVRHTHRCYALPLAAGQPASVQVESGEPSAEGREPRVALSSLVAPRSTLHARLSAPVSRHGP